MGVDAATLRSSSSSTSGGECWIWGWVRGSQVRGNMVGGSGNIIALAAVLVLVLVEGWKRGAVLLLRCFMCRLRVRLGCACGRLVMLFWTYRGGRGGGTTLGRRPGRRKLQIQTVCYIARWILLRRMIDIWFLVAAVVCGRRRITTMIIIRGCSSSGSRTSRRRRSVGSSAE